LEEEEMTENEARLNEARHAEDIMIFKKALRDLDDQFLAARSGFDQAVKEEDWREVYKFAQRLSELEDAIDFGERILMKKKGDCSR
jgi:hypothetical protein